MCDEAAHPVAAPHRDGRRIPRHPHTHTMVHTYCTPHTRACVHRRRCASGPQPDASHASDRGSTGREFRWRAPREEDVSHSIRRRGSFCRTETPQRGPRGHMIGARARTLRRRGGAPPTRRRAPARHRNVDGRQRLAPARPAPGPAAHKRACAARKPRRTPPPHLASPFLRRLVTKPVCHSSPFASFLLCSRFTGLRSLRSFVVLPVTHLFVLPVAPSGLWKIPSSDISTPHRTLPSVKTTRPDRQSIAASLDRTAPDANATARPFFVF